MKQWRGAAFLLPPSGGSPLLLIPQNLAPRLPKIPDDRITAAEAAERMKELIKNWPYSIENYQKNIKRLNEEIKKEK